MNLFSGSERRSSRSSVPSQNVGYAETDRKVGAKIIVFDGKKAFLHLQFVYVLK